MNNPAFHGDDFELLSLRLLDGEATEEDVAALRQVIATSEAMRKRAFLFLCDESLVADEIGNSQRASSLIESAALSPPAASKPTPPAGSRGLIRNALVGLLEGLNHHGLAVAAAAAVVVGGLLVHNMTMMAKVSRLHALVVQGESQEPVRVVVKDGRKTDDGSTDAEGDTPIGRVIGLNDVKWPDGVAELTYGDSLREGQSIQLESGSIELLLANGAKVTATGPVDLLILARSMSPLSTRAIGSQPSAISQKSRAWLRADSR